MKIDSYIKSIKSTPTEILTGRLIAIHGLIIEAAGCDVQLGELVEITQLKDSVRIRAEVVGLRNERILLMPFSSVQGLSLDSSVIPLNKTLTIPVGDCLLGRVIDPLGESIDEKGGLNTNQQRLSYAAPINPLHRTPIREYLSTGVRAIDIFCPLGKGQRIGIMAGSGVGKSTLLGMVSKHTDADIIVIALIGERGREVGDFVRDSLGEEGLKRAVVVVAPAEQPAVLRRQAAYTATTIAEWFRSRNKHVLLIMDSITRFAMAQREIGLASGEPIGTRGYPASVFSLLPPLLERGGAINNQGSITSIFTVLVEGDDINEPISDHMRSILDGHVVLSRDLAVKGHFPAIDIRHSISRLNNALLDTREQNTAQKIRASIDTYASSEDLINLGAYDSGKNGVLDNAVKLKPSLDRFVMQTPNDVCNLKQSWDIAHKLANQTVRG